MIFFTITLFIGFLAVIIHKFVGNYLLACIISAPVIAFILTVLNWILEGYIDPRALFLFFILMCYSFFVSLIAGIPFYIRGKTRGRETKNSTGHT